MPRLAPRILPCLAALAAALLLAVPAVAQHQMHDTTELVLNGEIPLFGNLGPYTRPIATSNPEAQAFFDQGLGLAYAFGRREAQQSFVAAMKKDPKCASCRWGLAWTLGPYVNDSTMYSGASTIAFEQAQEAKRLAVGSREVERALIDATLVRYEPEPTRRTRAELDTAYMVAMRDVARRFPDDPDVATLYAESIMVLRPWNYWTRAGRPQPGVAELLEVLERVLRRDPSHPGACHLYIHATEASLEPGRATSCADLLVDAMPGASHMVHMPSHTYMRLGRYDEAVRSSQLARAADKQAERGSATATYPDHNLHMLLVAASYDGQSAVAIQAARDLALLSPASAQQLPLVLARFGRWQEILQLPRSADAFLGAMLSYARGLAQVRTGGVAAARTSVQAVEAELRATTGRDNRVLLGIARAILSAEIDASARNYDAAVRTLEQARVLEADSLGYAEPEDWILPVRQVLGSVLLEAGRPADAEIAYRGELEAHPENGWSLYGLQLALEAQGKLDEAAAVLARFRRAWTRADVQIRGARF